MKLDRKYEIAAAAINSIARHDDEDQAIVLAVLDKLAQHAATERAAHIARKETKRDQILKIVG